ncbi:MAG TPA: MerR family transcriptional regulator [Solirubrobacteraceae bacterium]|nr:MerR family transcriptional regulator [Solirubrobacteraceae bacterium]
MDRGGQTVSATRFASLTGVSRDRLRTWERRYGFPVPKRVGSGPRRYHVEDVQRVVAVRRASEAGVPIARAIERTGYDKAPDHLASNTFAALVEHAPVPVVALSGPAPLRVEFVNGALRSLAGAPRPGEELTTALPAFTDSPCVMALQRLFATSAEPTEAEHPTWDGDPRRTMRSALFRLPAEPEARPLVAMLGLEGDGERVARAALADVRREVDELRRSEDRHTRWLDAIAAMAAEFRHETGRAAVDNGLDAVIRHTHAIDGAIAFYVSGQLVVPRSRRGLLESAPITVSAHPELARCLRDREAVWLEPAACAALGVPADLHTSAVPILVAGEPLGVLVFVFDEVEPHDDDNGRLLTAISAAMGFALLRDRLARELREVAGAVG